MKVLYFHQHYSSPRGSTGTRSYEMAKALKNDGHEILMVCGSAKGGQTGLSGAFKNGQRRGQSEGIEILEFDQHYSNHLGFVARTKAFLNYMLKGIFVAMREDYDVLFATSTPLTAGVPGIVATYIRRKKFVFEIRDLWPELPKAMGVIRNPLVLFLMRVLELSIYKSAHEIIILAPGMRDTLIADGVKPEAISFVPNGCDLHFFSPQGPKATIDKINPGDLTAVFAGTHGKANGLSVILDAAEILQNRGVEQIKLLLIGDGKEKSDLVKSAQSRGLQNVVFLNPIAKIELAKTLRSCDVGLQVLANHPVFYDGTSPNKFFDYISSGLPVLINYPGWLATMVEERKCGIVVPPDSPNDFADALQEFALQKKHSQLKGTRSRYLAESKFDRGHLSGNWVAVIKKAGKT